MKAYVLAVVVLISLTALVDCQRTRPPKPNRCTNSDDCDEGECCVGLWRGRCQKLREEGKSCVHELKFNGMHMMQCPCKDGLECIAGKRKTLPWGQVIYIRPRCTKPKDTTIEDEITTIPDISSEEVTTSDEQSSEEINTIPDIRTEEDTASAERSSEEFTTIVDTRREE